MFKITTVKYYTIPPSLSLSAIDYLSPSHPPLPHTTKWIVLPICKRPYAVVSWSKIKAFLLFYFYLVVYKWWQLDTNKWERSLIDKPTAASGMQGSEGTAVKLVQGKCSLPLWTTSPSTIYWVCGDVSDSKQSHRHTHIRQILDTKMHFTIWTMLRLNVKKSEIMLMQSWVLSI